MKKIAISLIYVFISLASFAQARVDTVLSDHLIFEGIPIDGPLDEFISRLRQKGFTRESTEDGLVWLAGDFAGYKNCHVNVWPMKEKDLVFLVGVKLSLPERATWVSLEADYSDLQNMLTQKYGEPVEKSVRFMAPPDATGMELSSIKAELCRYDSYLFYRTDKGSISLKIMYAEGRSSVSLVHLDKLNSGIMMGAALDGEK